jgi:type II secretory pathway pseudopilin PulG
MERTPSRNRSHKEITRAARLIPPASPRGVSRRQRGSAYVVTLAALTVALILGLALMRVSTNSIQGAQRFTKKLQLQYIAEAGAEFGYWYCATQSPTLPTDMTKTLGDGQFTVHIEESGVVAGTIKVTSTATLAGQQLKTTYLFPAPAAVAPDDVFSYAVCANGNLSTSYPMITTGPAGSRNDVGVNGQLSWTNSQSSITGNCYATSGISTPYPTVWGRKNTAADPVSFPAIDLARYKANADVVVTAKKDYFYSSGIVFPHDGAIIYSDTCRILIQGPITGRGTIICSKEIQLVSDIYYTDSNSKIAYVSTTQVSVPINCPVVGAMYAHNSSNNAYIYTGWATVASGCVIGDRYSIVGGPVTVTHDPDFEDANLRTLLHLPGYW